MRKVNKGDILVAINECRMDEGGNTTLTIGKGYKVLMVRNNEEFFVLDDENDTHAFSFGMAHEFFDMTPPPPKYVRIDGHPTAYPCEVIGEWNGFAVPRFSREVMYLFAYNQPDEEGYDKFVVLDAGDLVISEWGDESVKDIIVPNDDGTYDMPSGYCFILVEN